MKIINEFPPNYKKIEKVFNLSGITPVFTYGDTIYNPHKCIIPRDLIIHEETHMRQQYYPTEWWDRYLIDPTFRLEQELEAYRNQFKFYRGAVKGWMPFLKRIASDLSGRMYGNIISYQDAFNAILK